MFTKLATIIAIAAATFVGIGATANAIPAKCANIVHAETVKVCNPNAQGESSSPNVPAPDRTVIVPELVKVVDVEATLVTPEVSHVETRSHEITIGGQMTTNRSGK